MDFLKVWLQEHGISFYERIELPLLLHIQFDHFQADFFSFSNNKTFLYSCLFHSMTIPLFIYLLIYLIIYLLVY